MQAVAPMFSGFYNHGSANAPSPSASPSANSTATCVPMYNFYNAQYTASALIGTPPQTLKVVPDTGSFDLLIASTLCTDGACKAHARFDPVRSASYLASNSSDVPMAYGQGEAIASGLRLSELQHDPQWQRHHPVLSCPGQRHRSDSLKRIG